MPKVTSTVNSLTSGEWSRKGKGRFDLAKYASGATKLENFIINQLGGVSFRPGTRYVKETKDSSKASRLMPFQYAADLDYVIEVGDEYMRFFANDATTIDAPADWDSYYMLMLHGDGTDLGTTITDEIGKTVTNTAAYDTYTKLCSKFDGNNGAVAYTDPIAGAYTFQGTAQLSTAQKKFGTASLLLDGNSDYVTLPDSASWDFGTGDFTIDGWFRWSAYSAANLYQLVNHYDGGAVSWFCYLETGYLTIQFINGATNIKRNVAFTPTIDTWYHLAFVRSTTTAKIFINGISQTLSGATDFGTSDVGTTTGVLCLGRDNVGASNYFAGWIDELRISKGIARWTTDFTPPVAPYGQVTIDTGVKKFGTGSMLFDGGGSNLTVADSADWDFGTGAFTVDLWIDPYDVSTNYRTFFDSRAADNSAGFSLSIDNAGHLLMADTGARITGTNALVVGTQYHVAIVGNGGADGARTIKLYLNGVQEGSTYTANYNYTGTRTLKIGIDASSAYYYYGYIDELRVSKGVARWTSNFTPPTTAYEKTVETLEVVTPYLESDIFDVQYAQNNDILYLVHPDYAPRKLSRTSATEFSIAEVSFVRGPFLDDNITATTITPSAATGTGITLTASAALFDDPLHVGSLWRINKDSTHGAVVKITAVADSTHATADVQAEPDGVAGNIGGIGAYTDWAEGAFSDYRGWPSAIAFHEQRLYYANTEEEPQKFWGSVIGAYDNFSSGYGAAGAEATVTDDDAITFEVATEQRNAIKWLSSGNKGLTLGSQGGTFTASSGSLTEPISASNIMVNRDTNYGAAGIMPKRISSFLYYVQRDFLRLRELSYNFNIDSTISSDMTLLAEHILKDGDGVVDIDHQQSPNDRIYCVRSDGQISVLTRNPEQDVMGWCRIVAGDDAQGAGLFESIVVILKAEADDQVWVIVNRNIGGSTKRFIEFFTPESFDEDWDAVNCDSSLTLDDPKTITAATSADPVVITSASHGFSNGDQVKINGVVGMTELNSEIFLVANKDTNTFELTDLDGNDIDGTAYTTYISGGEVRKMVTAISGLSHLEGETVVAQVDGYIPSTETFVVSGGAITLPSKAAVVHVGLPYEGTIQLLKLSDGSATGTGQTKTRRIYHGTLRLDRSQGLSIGRAEGALDDLAYDDSSLFTGDKEKVFQTNWDNADEIIIRQDKATPASVLAVIMKSEVEEG